MKVRLEPSKHMLAHRTWSLVVQMAETVATQSTVNRTRCIPT